MDLREIELDPAKLDAGCIWRIWRDGTGAIDGETVAVQPDGQPWVRVVPIGVSYEQSWDVVCRPYLDRIRSGKPLTTDERRALEGQAHGRATLRGWGGLTENGAAMVYTEAKAIELMTEPRWKAMRDFVVAAARHQAAAARSEEEKAAGN